MESVVVTGESWIIKPNTISNKQTGASGVLGSAIYKAFETSGYLLLGLANSRTREGLRKLDLTDQTAVEDTLREVKPKCQFFRKKILSHSWLSQTRSNKMSFIVLRSVALM